METRKLDFARSCENLLDVGGVCGLAKEDIGGSEDKYRNSGKFIENLAELIVLNFPMILKARLQVKYIIYILVIIILSDQTL